LALQFASMELRSNKIVVLEAIKQDCWALEYASNTLKSDKEVVIEAIKQDSDVLGLYFISEEIKNNKLFILEAIKQDGFMLKYASSDLRKDKEVVIKALKENGLALEYASMELRNNKEVVLKAVKQNGYALQYASMELRNNKEVVLEAVKQKEDSLQFASKELQNIVNSNNNYFEELEQPLKVLDFKEWKIQNKDKIVEDYKKNKSTEDLIKEQILFLDLKNNKIEIKTIRNEVDKVGKELYNKYVEDFNSTIKKNEPLVEDNVSNETMDFKMPKTMKEAKNRLKL
jgi:hypothetical protein